MGSHLPKNIHGEDLPEHFSPREETESFLQIAFFPCLGRRILDNHHGAYMEIPSTAMATAPTINAIRTWPWASRWFTRLPMT